MQFCSLGSGSRGNATLLQAGETLLLIDCGFSAKQLELRLDLIGVQASQIDALLLTHEHGDHVRGAPVLSRRYNIPVWATPGTSSGCQWHDDVDLNLFNPHSGGFRIGDVDVTPFTVPHDAREPCQYVFNAAGKRFGMLTDVGTITPHIVEQLSGLDSLLLEANHDLEMLANGPYPRSLQARVSGSHGHLNNGQSASLVERLDSASNWTHLVCAHISEKNNHPELVRKSFSAVDDALAARMTILVQDGPSAWFEI